MRRRMTRYRNARVVPNVQSLVGVRGPRVKPLHAGGEVLGRCRCGRPQPKRPVDVNPGRITAFPMPIRRGSDLHVVIKRAVVDVARLRTNDRRTGEALQSLLQMCHIHT